MTGDDLLLRQLVALRAPDLPARTHGGATGVWIVYGAEGTPDLAIVGDPGDTVALAESYAAPQFSVPLAAAGAVRDRLGLAEPLGWAFRWTDEAPKVDEDGTEWLPASAGDDVTALIAAGFPDASLPFGHPSVRRWAGLRRDGRLVACLADATVAPDLGFLASIVSHPDARGTGAGKAVTAWATGELVAEHGICGLWHMSDNTVAARLYDALGYRDDTRMAFFPNPH